MRLALDLQCLWVRLAHDLQCLWVNVCCIQQTWFSTCNSEYILSKVLYSTYFDRHSGGVSSLVSKSLDVTCALVFADPLGRLYMLDIAIRNITIRLFISLGFVSSVTMWNSRICFKLFLMTYVVLVGDGKAVLDLDLDHTGERFGSLSLSQSSWV